ncbi:MAG: hypothetical protein GY710_00815 [Desulfobacteraceae bacterium]|nr:hypothetical protein [Desulfobacteraceae bacterium]
MNKWFCSVLMVCVVSISPVLADEPGSWEFYKQIFITGDGRVTDFFQDKSSHSEGQGYGLLLSVFHNDKPTFESLLAWTKNNLMIRKDFLSAWHWGRQLNGQWGVTDYNNATDGDLLIAWALLVAAEKWEHTAYKVLAMNILSDIKAKLVVKKNGRTLLLPGFHGFDSPGEIALNPSYFIYPAFEMFARVDDPIYWKMIFQQSFDISFQKVFTRFRLPPDWLILVGKEIRIDKERSKNFGYEAIRIPLYLALSNKKASMDAFTPLLSFYEKTQFLPSVVDLVDSQVSINEAPAGFFAVFSLCSRLMGKTALSRQLMSKAEQKIIHESQDYYLHSLYLLARTKTKS